MDEKKDIRGLFEEDDGEEITSKKATLEDIAAKEKEEEKQAKPVLTVEEQKAKDKKSNKLTGIIMGSIIGVAIIAGIIVTVMRKDVIRELPFRLDGISEADLNDVDYQDGEWYVANQQNYCIPVTVTDICNMYDKPTARGNAIMSFNANDTVVLLGDVYDTKKKTILDWGYILAGDKKGYIKTENISMLIKDTDYDFSFEQDLVNDQPQKEEVVDEDREAFYKQKLVENMNKANETAEAESAATDYYLDLYNELQQLTRQINEGIVFITDEGGNTIEVPYEYSPEEMQQLLEEQAKVSEELDKVREEMEITATDEEVVE